MNKLGMLATCCLGFFIGAAISGDFKSAFDMSLGAIGFAFVMTLVQS